MAAAANASRYEPPPGGSGWSSAAASPLLYLAWGERRYGITPIPAQPRSDWIYVAPRAGAPTVLLGRGRRRLAAGQCAIIAPGQSSGYVDEPAGRCVIQTWVWRPPPAFPPLLPGPSGFRVLELGRAQAQELREIHDACRREVQSPDAYSATALATLRTRLDLCLVRTSDAPARPAPAGHRLALALRWLAEHLDDHSPTRGLCDYLQISPDKLLRLFSQELGHGPREAALGLRVREARRLLDEGWSVKATAFHLGYRHANDLSRVLSRRER